MSLPLLAASINGGWRLRWCFPSAIRGSCWQEQRGSETKDVQTRGFPLRRDGDIFGVSKGLGMVATLVLCNMEAGDDRHWVVEVGGV
ncbi:hypothetical protein V6N11_056075 [Hibiscus sabdariffa]|uniref:Uncharacterized protein n=1 Tax=Hibiscus sabdariffa TaxID=183260 RepID=A0ABR2T330_9ROSI